MTEKTEIVENCLYRLKERRDRTPEQVQAIDDFMAAVGGEALADLYDLIRFHDGPHDDVKLDSGTARLVKDLAQLRADIANHRLAGLVGSYPELQTVDTATPCSPLVTIRTAVQREVARLEQVAKDCGLRP